MGEEKNLIVNNRSERKRESSQQQSKGGDFVIKFVNASKVDFHQINIDHVRADEIEGKKSLPKLKCSTPPIKQSVPFPS